MTERRKGPDQAAGRRTPREPAAEPLLEAGSGVVDPDVDLAVPAPRREPAGHRLDVLGAIAAGGVLGAEARYGLGLALPHAPKGWPWSTLLVNISGCLLIGVLMVVITELVRPHRLVRPFLGVGVLGGYTTFSTATVDALTLLDAGRPAAALGYLVATPALAVLGCAIGVVAARLLAGRSLRPPAETPR
ncbi:fluoride efflux transporter FluC [Pseudonocardia nigra]|uniref:fluoride efflux transporter FluC n=1 Tax=Pseudonocardia nigra TaxID=1921578 RepID=UPI001C5F3901|nr:CrcB family protein [Pseudonocardia nigra]